MAKAGKYTARQFSGVRINNQNPLELRPGDHVSYMTTAFGFHVQLTGVVRKLTSHCFRGDCVLLESEP
jgi:hypothetical protein